MTVKQVQIDERLFYDLAKYHCLGQQNEELESRIREGLEQKVEKMAARQRYAERLKTESRIKVQQMLCCQKKPPGPLYQSFRAVILLPVSDR